MDKEKALTLNGMRNGYISTHLDRYHDVFDTIKDAVPVRDNDIQKILSKLNDATNFQQACDCLAEPFGVSSYDVIFVGLSQLKSKKHFMLNLWYRFNKEFMKYVMDVCYGFNLDLWMKLDKRYTSSGTWYIRSSDIDVLCNIFIGYINPIITNYFSVVAASYYSKKTGLILPYVHTSKRIEQGKPREGQEDFFLFNVLEKDCIVTPETIANIIASSGDNPSGGRLYIYNGTSFEPFSTPWKTSLGGVMIRCSVDEDLPRYGVFYLNNNGGIDNHQIETFRFKKLMASYIDTIKLVCRGEGFITPIQAN